MCITQSGSIPNSKIRTARVAETSENSTGRSRPLAFCAQLLVTGPHANYCTSGSIWTLMTEAGVKGNVSYKKEIKIKK
jgi:hypothetical protein